MPEPLRRPPSLRAALTAAGVALMALAAGAAAVQGFHARAAAPTVAAAAPLPVRAATLRLEADHEVVERFLGRIEPARETRVGFERGGRVIAAPIEEGDRIAAGAVLARLDDAALQVEARRLAAQRAADQADLALAQATLERSAALSDRGHLTGQSLDEARFSADAARARLAVVDALIAAVALDIEKSTLSAPFAGTIAARLLDEGAVVAAGAALALVQETARPRARIGLPADRARALTPGADFTVDAPSGPVAARLIAVAPDVDPATRTVAALFDLDPAAPVAMGEVVRLRLPRRAEGAGAWVALSALREGTRGLWALWLIEDGRDGPVAKPVEVEALHVADGRAFVRGALPDGGRIVAEGAERVTAGAPLRVLP